MVSPPVTPTDASADDHLRHLVEARGGSFVRKPYGFRAAIGDEFYAIVMEDGLFFIHGDIRAIDHQLLTTAAENVIAWKVAHDAA